MTSKTYYSLAAGLLVGALLLSSAPAHALSSVDCATVNLDLADAKAAKTCSEGDIGENMWHGTAQEMNAKGEGYFLHVRRVKAGFRSYVSVVDVRDIAAVYAQDLFVAPVRVIAHDTVSGYAIALFSGRLQEEPKRALDCFVFSRYGGTLNPRGGFNGAPGYANRLSGGYCTNKGISDSTIDRVLGELRAPME
jgi:hypothetical protein